MYNVIFKICGSEVYQCLGFFKEDNSIEYPSFEKRTIDSKYFYLRLSREDIIQNGFKINGLYSYNDGKFKLFELNKPTTHEDTYEDYKELKEKIKRSNLYDVLSSMLWDYHSKIERNIKGESSLYWIKGDKGFGKTYILKVIEKSINRPVIMIDCSKIKNTIGRFISNEIFEIMLEYFECDLDKINNAVILLDNFDKINITDCSIEEFMVDFQRHFKNSYNTWHVTSKKYGEVKIHINNNIVFFASNKGLEVYEKFTTYYYYFQKYLGDYIELKFDEETCYQYINYDDSYLNRIINYYKSIGIELVFEKDFIDELVKRVLYLKEGYYGFEIIINNLLKEININDKKELFSEIVFHNFNDITFVNKRVMC